MTSDSAMARTRRRDTGTWGVEAVAALWAWLVMGGGFIGLALHAASGHVARTDLRLLNAAQRIPGNVAPWVELQTWLGSPLVLASATLAFAFALCARGARAEGAAALASFGVFALTVAIKHAVAEPPPYFEVAAPYKGLLESNYSFPSGHVVGLSVLSGLVFLFAGRLVPYTALAWTLRTAAVVSVASVGAGRVWLGVHYPSDVIAGYLLAALYLLPVWFCFHSSRRTMRRTCAT